MDTEKPRSGIPVPSNTPLPPPTPPPSRAQVLHDYKMDEEQVHNGRANTSAFSAQHVFPSTPQSPTPSPPSPVETAATSFDRGGRKEGKKKKPMRKVNRALRKWNPALTLENSGSVARDHLASERTFLAYVRTSLTIASTGVALVQLFTISAAASNKSILRFARPLGATVIVLGLLVLFFGAVRYFMIQSALIRGKYPVARISAVLMAVVLATIILIVFGIILGVRQQ